MQHINFTFIFFSSLLLFLKKKKSLLICVVMAATSNISVSHAIMKNTLASMITNCLVLYRSLTGGGSHSYVNLVLKERKPDRQSPVVSVISTKATVNVNISGLKKTLSPRRIESIENKGPLKRYYYTSHGYGKLVESTLRLLVYIVATKNDEDAEDDVQKAANLLSPRITVFAKDIKRFSTEFSSSLVPGFPRIRKITTSVDLFATILSPQLKDAKRVFNEKEYSFLFELDALFSLIKLSSENLLPPLIEYGVLGEVSGFTSAIEAPVLKQLQTRFNGSRGLSSHLDISAYAVGVL